MAEEAPVNPVEAGPAVAPKDETGKFDVTKIAEASDFTGVEEESGCKKTFEAVKGAKNVIVHFYNSTSTLQRKVVFKEDMPGIIKIAVEGAKLIRQLTEEEIASSGMNIRYEYSPESFTGTEIDFAIEICESVMETLGATNENPIILNLPSTVEMSTPNTYADQIEYFCTKMKNREAAIISIHPHNDRGTGVAAAELAMLAGG